MRVPSIGGGSATKEPKPSTASTELLTAYRAESTIVSVEHKVSARGNYDWANTAQRLGNTPTVGCASGACCQSCAPPGTSDSDVRDRQPGEQPRIVCRRPPVRSKRYKLPTTRAGRRRHIDHVRKSSSRCQLNGSSAVSSKSGRPKVTNRIPTYGRRTNAEYSDR